MVDQGNIRQLFGQYISIDATTIIARAPGRVNLIGEHTDYNYGLVLPGAIDKNLYFGLTPNGTNQINAFSIDLNDRVTTDLDNLTKVDNAWVDFITGILLEFKKRNVCLSGFDCVLTSDVPIGSGMSSSSALECAVLTALNQLFGTKLEPWDLIHMSQASNHHFMGVQGGILDQFASLFGKKDKVMFLDCDTLEYEYITIPKSEYTWLLINTCVKHSHLTSGYNDRVSECQSALKSIQLNNPKIKHLSEVKSIEEINDVTWERAVTKRRVTFIIEENQRVRDFIAALKHTDFERCGQLLYQSHRGLSQQYEVSCPELDYLVDELRHDDRILGSRMMGGGFGGCTINLVKKDAVSSIKTKIKKAYKEQWNIAPEFYSVAISDGATVL